MCNRRDYFTPDIKALRLQIKTFGAKATVLREEARRRLWNAREYPTFPARKEDLREQAHVFQKWARAEKEKRKYQFLAYGYLRGVPYKEIEGKTSTPPDPQNLGDAFPPFWKDGKFKRAKKGYNQSLLRLWLDGDHQGLAAEERKAFKWDT